MTPGDTPLGDLERRSLGQPSSVDSNPCPLRPRRLAESLKQQIAELQGDNACLTKEAQNYDDGNIFKLILEVGRA